MATNATARHPVRRLLRRVPEYGFPLVDAAMRASYGMASAVNKVLILDGDMAPARISVVLIAESVGW